ncbi:MAG: hypothetical protein JSV29_03915 [Candidatus Bathyarchaeota archaeon]|nr:MAG: hypothetical protein JSV29_03915 [Candidatus Bathyarchaeota archaeon]
MKRSRKLISTIILGALLTTLMLPLATVFASAEGEQKQIQVRWRTQGNWTYIQNDKITIVFPAGGKKPMFLWWYTEDPENINVVKYKGLIEYVTFDQPYFVWKYQAWAWRIRERIEARYYDPISGTIQNQLRLRAILWILSEIGNFTGLHSPYLPFSGCRWELSTPMNVTKGDVEYLSFNFTLVDVPEFAPNLQFAENNVIIRCRFYYTPATEDVDGQYTYSVDAGELKMDLVVKHWDWNIDKLKPLLEELSEEGIGVPRGEAGLALWINLASINMTKLAEDDALAAGDTNSTEAASATRNIYVEGQRVSTVQDKTGLEDEQPLQNRARERFTFRFERGNATFAGFFKFVPKALVRDPANNAVIDVVDVTASYIPAGRHMRVFLGYPYFGNNTLEHDPSLGIESLPQLITLGLVMVLVGVTAVIAAVILVVRRRGRIVNVVGVR